jgi:ketosteroid isomerase-like protein
MAADMKAGVFDTTLARYTDDAISMPNFGPMVRGKAEISAWHKQMHEMEMEMMEVNFTVTDVEVGGKYAYEIGTYDMTYSVMGMPPQPDKGKYLTVWELGADGSWRIKAETWNTSMEPPMPGMDDDEDDEDDD